jgi:hypothetical protein
MKILQTKLSNTTTYLLLVFAIASAALFFYGQFSNLTYETINNTTSEVTPVVNNVQVEDDTLESIETLPLDDTVSDPSLDMESDMMSEPLFEETPAVE